MKKTPAYTNGFQSFEFILRALRHRNYRLFFLGQCVSLLGTWIQTIATVWLAYKLTNSAFYLGLIGFTNQIPALFITPFSGVLADRLNKRQILIVTQSLAMIQAFILAFITLTGVVTIWHLIILGMMLGAVTAFDVTTRHSFVIELVGNNKDNLGNAIALNSFTINGTRLMGPAIAGILIARFGEGLCFLINALSYLAVIYALFMIRLPAAQVTEQSKNIFYQIKEGAIYTYRHKRIRYALMLFGMVNFLGVSYSVLMPAFSTTVLGGGPKMLGFLMGAVGLGALAGAVYVASKKLNHSLPRTIVIASGFFGLGLSAFALSKSYHLSLLLLMGCGFALIVQIASTNTLIQTLTDDDKRGRVMSFYTMAFFGMAPIGSLLCGWLAESAGVQKTLFLSGLLIILGASMLFKKMTKKPTAGPALP